MSASPVLKFGYGICLSRQGPAIGPASQITYTVRYSTNDGMFEDVPNQKPSARWLATDVVAHPTVENPDEDGKPRSFIFASVDGKVISFFPPEPPHVTECGA